MWSVILLDERVMDELREQPQDIQTQFERIVVLMRDYGFEGLPRSYIRPLAKL